MHSHYRYDISDTEQVTPHIRLCHKILRESLLQGATAVELVGAGSVPVVNRQVDGNWQPYIQIPAPAFTAIVLQLKQMGQVTSDPAPASGTIHVRHAGRDHDIVMVTHRASDDVEILTLRLPASPVAAAAAT